MRKEVGILEGMVPFKARMSILDYVDYYGDSLKFPYDSCPKSNNTSSVYRQKKVNYQMQIQEIKHPSQNSFISSTV